MSRTRTLAQLRADVRYRAEIEGLTERHPDANINRLINESWQALREELMDHSVSLYLAEAHGTLTVGPSTLSDADATPLPFGVLELTQAVAHIYGISIRRNNVWHELEQVSMAQRDRYQGRSQNTGVPVAFSLHSLGVETTTTVSSRRIAIFPAPDAAYVYTVWYVPAWTDRTNDTDVLDGVAGWEEWVVWDVCVKIGYRDQDVPLLNNAVQERAGALQRILKGASRVQTPGWTTRKDTRRGRGSLPRPFLATGGGTGASGGAGTTPTLALVLAEGNAANAKITALTAGATGTTEAANVTQVETLADAAQAAAEATAGAALTAHIAADDHTMYARVNGARAWTADQAWGGNDLTAVGSLQQTGATLPSGGFIRLAFEGNGTAQIQGILADGSTTVGLFNWGLATNRLVVGAATVERLTLDVSAAGFAEVRTNGTSRQAWEATVISSAIPWSRGNAASGAMQSYPAGGQAVATDTDFDTSQTVVQTVPLAVSRQYAFTAIATVKDAAGADGTVLWTRTLFGRYYRKSSGNALQLNDGAGDDGGRECHLYEASGSESDFTFAFAVSTTNVTATLTNVAGANNLCGDVEITWTEMPLR